MKSIHPGTDNQLKSAKSIKFNVDEQQVFKYSAKGKKTKSVKLKKIRNKLKEEQ